MEDTGMKSVSIRSSKSDRKQQAPHQQRAEQPTLKSQSLPQSPDEGLHALIEKRAYELYAERNYRQGVPLDDWLAAEREVLSQFPQV
jgi:hypothetical protein